MKFIKLEILNLASLDSDNGEVIDFEEGALGESTIFSIVGPTGSGKSTILDAICLALYNRAPRYPKQKGDKKQKIEIYGSPDEDEKNRLAPTDPINILSRGKKHGYSKLTFVANNGTVYRAEWNVSKKRVNYDLKTELYKISGSDGRYVETLDDWKNLPSIIGLDYEQFLRTVLIAQGSFASFLSASEEDRYTLLEKLVGSEEMYTRISLKIKEKKDAAEDAYKEITAQLKAWENSIIPEDELSELLGKISALEEAEKKAKAELDSVKNALGWYAAEEQFEEKIFRFTKDFEEAGRQLEDIKPEADRLALHDAALDALTLYKEIQDCISNIENLKKSLEQQEKAASEKTAEIEAENKNLAELQQKATDASDELTRQQPHINRAREIKAQLGELYKNEKEKTEAEASAEKALNDANDAVTKNGQAINTASNELEKAKSAYNNLIAEIEEKKKSLKENADTAVLNWTEESAKLNGKDRALLQKARDEAKNRQTDLNNAIRIQGDLRNKLNQRKESESKQQELTGRNREIDELLGKFDIEALSKEVETLTKSHTLMTSENWEQHRLSLKDGDPCPLCGSKAHFYHSAADAQPVINDLGKLLREKNNELEGKRKNKQDLDKEKYRNDGSLKSLENTLKNLSEDIAKLNKEWEPIHARYAAWPEDADSLKAMESDIEDTTKTAEKELNDYDELADKVAGLRDKKDKALKERSDYESTSNSLKQAADEKKTEADTTLKTEQAKTENLKLQAEEKKEAFVAAKKSLETIVKDIMDRKAALKAETGDADPDALEAKLKKAKADAQQKAEDKNAQINDLTAERKRIAGAIEQIKQNEEQENKKQKDKANALNSWITEYNKKNEQKLSDEIIARLYSAADNWEAIRKRSAEIKEKVTKAKTTLENEKNSQTEHQKIKPDKDKETLLHDKEELEKRSDEELVKARSRKQNHDDAIAQIGSMNEARTVAETNNREWTEITDAIGKDGKTLRKIAQCYTLRFLVEHANAEIRKFNSRYELQQVKNSLGLRVIDHDRADDVRDTTSLSGGETFIVSLGLALGLSSLSSKNISFENLFIDEGFGTLDPDTLATVIDSLAMLQSSQGKKVGVISHTDTMSERITTQIRIIKNGHTGSSHIEIYP